MTKIHEVQWRKSSRSAQANDACVELGSHNAEMLGVRDSKNPAGPVLALPWSSLLAAVKTDRIAR